MHPIVLRELRSESRKPANYWLRTLAAILLLWLLGLEHLRDPSNAIGRGAAPFARLNLALFMFLWVAVALMVSDCISREKREGTFGLLFLTPLRPWEIAVAKLSAHAIRSLTLLAAAVPVLVVPVLFGGVTWREVLRVVLLDLSALSLALATGFLASSCSWRAGRAALLALGLSLGAGATFAIVHSCYRVWELIQLLKLPFDPGTFLRFFKQYWLTKYRSMSSWFDERPKSFTGGWGQTFGVADTATLILAAAMLAGSILAAGAVVLFASRIIRRTWRDEPGRNEVIWLRLLWPTMPGLEAWTKRRSKRSRERNPYSWLERRTIEARLSTWRWLTAVFVVGAGLTWFGGNDGWGMAGSVLPAGLMLAIAVRSANAFREDHESGFLELLLCTPAQPRGILSAKLLSLLYEFGPALLVVLIGSAFRWGQMFVRQFDWQEFASGLPVEAVEMTVRMCLVAATGLYLGLRRVNGRWVIALLAGLWVPKIAFWLADLVSWMSFYFAYLVAAYSPPGSVSQVNALTAYSWIVSWIFQAAVILLLLRRTYCIMDRRHVLLV